MDVLDLLVEAREHLRATLVLVTHEPDIAEYAARRIVFRDGQVIEDAPVTARRRAVAP